MVRVRLQGQCVSSLKYIYLGVFPLTCTSQPCEMKGLHGSQLGCPAGKELYRVNAPEQDEH